jgi:hypothetical protein
MLPSGLPDAVGDEEYLARFIKSSRVFNSAGLVKPPAFLPNPKDGQTSVFRNGVEDIPELWTIGRGMICEDGRTLYGAAFILAQDVRQASLEVNAHEPPDRHANIEGWPVDDDVQSQKAKQKMLAMRLCQCAMLETINP